VVGNGHADKEQVQMMVQRLLKLSGTPSPDAADALGLRDLPCARRDGTGRIGDQGFRVRGGRLV